MEAGGALRVGAPPPPASSTTSSGQRPHSVRSVRPPGSNLKQGRQRYGKRFENASTTRACETPSPRETTTPQRRRLRSVAWLIALLRVAPRSTSPAVFSHAQFQSHNVRRLRSWSWRLRSGGLRCALELARPNSSRQTPRRSSVSQRRSDTLWT